MLMRLLTLHHTATHWSCDITYAYDTAHTATRRNTQLHSAHVMSHTPVAVTSAAAPLAAAGAAPLLQTAKAVAVCCSVLQYIILQCAALCFSMLCCSVLQCFSLCCRTGAEWKHCQTPLLEPIFFGAIHHFLSSIDLTFEILYRHRLRRLHDCSRHNLAVAARLSSDNWRHARHLLLHRLFLKIQLASLFWRSFTCTTAQAT